MDFVASFMKALITLQQTLLGSYKKKKKELTRQNKPPKKASQHTRYKQQK